MRHLDCPNIVTDNEKGKIIVYLDNATIINACSILTNPRGFDPYKLLDLESFCQAFLLFDHVRTLVGSSFACGFSSSYKIPRTSRSRPRDFAKAVWVHRKDLNHRPRTMEAIGNDAERAQLDTESLYADLIDKGLLRPVVLAAGTVHYHIENIEVLDEISNSINIAETVRLVQTIFGDKIPWAYPAKKPHGDHEPEDDAWHSLIIGEETWTSDSYPMYHFSRPESERKERKQGDLDFGWELNHNRRTTWVETFISQTFFYVIEAALHKKPYLSSSVRLPIVQSMVNQLNSRFFSVVHGCLGTAGEDVRKKVEAVLQFFGEGAIRSVFLPALFCVLRESNSREDIVPALISMREREDVKSFREWCRGLNEAWEEQDLDRIYHSIEELRTASEDMCEALAVSPLQGNIAFVSDVKLLTEEGSNTSRLSGEALVRACYNPSLAFLKDIGSCLSAFQNNLGVIEDLLEHKLNECDLKVLGELQAQRDRLYSQGRILRRPRRIRVEKMEVTMGDTFKDVQNAIIATRGSIAEGVISLKEQGNADTAKAISDLDRLIAEVSDKLLPPKKKAESAELLNGIAEEASKPRPSKNVLRSLGHSLLGVVTGVELLAKGGKAAFDIIKSLWS